MNKAREVIMLARVADLIAPVFKTLDIKETLDLQEEVDVVQLCVAEYIICADAKSDSFDVIAPLDKDGEQVAVICFPTAIYAARYIVGRFV